MGRHRDGFHEVETILQSVNLSDTLDIELNSSSQIQLTCSDHTIPTDETNLVHRALVAMRPFAGSNLGARIHIEKHVPVGAGLGGGSANAAGVMLAVCHDRKLQIEPDKLAKVAARLGSDIPFMLQGGTMLGRGKGEKLEALHTVKNGVFLIVKPNINISTAWVYANYNFRLTKHRPRINLKAVNAVLSRFPTASMSFRNCLEDVVCPRHPVVASLLDELLSAGPCHASMSGSGSAVFAVFEHEDRARELAERFSVKGFFTSVVEPARRAVDIN